MPTIVAIHKPDRNSPVEAISLVKTADGKVLTVNDVVWRIKVREEPFDVWTGPGLEHTEVRAELSAAGNWFIKTVPNDTKVDNLLSLPEIFPGEYPPYIEPRDFSEIGRSRRLGAF